MQKARKLRMTSPETCKKARELEGWADSLKAEAEALKGAARLEDLHIWQMEKTKTTKKGNKELLQDKMIKFIDIRLALVTQ